MSFSADDPRSGCCHSDYEICWTLNPLSGFAIENNETLFIPCNASQRLIGVYVLIWVNTLCPLILRSCPYVFLSLPLSLPPASSSALQMSTLCFCLVSKFRKSSLTILRIHFITIIFFGFCTAEPSQSPQLLSNSSAALWLFQQLKHHSWSIAVPQFLSSSLVIFYYSLHLYHSCSTAEASSLVSNSSPTAHYVDIFSLFLLSVSLLLYPLSVSHLSSLFSLPLLSRSCFFITNAHADHDDGTE